MKKIQGSTQIHVYWQGAVVEVVFCDLTNAANLIKWKKEELDEEKRNLLVGADRIGTIGKIGTTRWVPEHISCQSDTREFSLFVNDGSHFSAINNQRLKFFQYIRRRQCPRSKSRSRSVSLNTNSPSDIAGGLKRWLNLFSMNGSQVTLTKTCPN